MLLPLQVHPHAHLHLRALHEVRWVAGQTSLAPTREARSLPFRVGGGGHRHRKSPARAPPISMLKSLASRSVAAQPVFHLVSYARLSPFIRSALPIRLATPTTSAMSTSSHSQPTTTADESMQTNGLSQPHAGELAQENIADEGRWSVAKGM